MIHEKQHSDSTDDSIMQLCANLVNTWLSVSKAEAQELNQLQSMEKSIVIDLSFHFCLQIQQSGFH